MIKTYQLESFGIKIDVYLPKSASYKELYAAGEQLGLELFGDVTEDQVEYFADEVMEMLRDAQQEQKTTFEPWEVAMGQIDELHSMLDDLPEAAGEFAESVLEQSSLVAKWVEENEAVSPKQLKAIQNWTSGVEGWLGR